MKVYNVLLSINILIDVFSIFLLSINNTIYIIFFLLFYFFSFYIIFNINVVFYIEIFSFLNLSRGSFYKTGLYIFFFIFKIIVYKGFI